MFLWWLLPERLSCHQAKQPEFFLWSITKRRNPRVPYIQISFCVSTSLRGYNDVSDSKDSQIDID